MPLRKLTLLIIVITSMALAGALYTISSVIISRSFSDLENTHVVNNIDRVLDALAHDTSSLNLKAADWAEWDDTYVFVEDVNDHYIKENLTDETFQILRANVLVFLDREKRVRYKQGFDLAGSRPVDLKQDELSEILAIPGLTFHEHEKSHVAGIALLSRGPMLVASRPILNSQHAGPVRGALIMGRYLDKDELEELSKRVHTDLTIKPIKSLDSDANFQRAWEILSGGAANTVISESDDYIAGFAVIKDVQGDPSLLLKVLMPRDIARHGAWTTNYLLISLTIVTAIFGVVTLVVIERLVLSRLLALESELRTIGESKRTDLRVSVSGSDEITKLATSINQALQSVEKSAEEIRNNSDTIKALLNASLDIAILVDRKGRFLAMNEATAKALNSEIDSLVGRDPLEFFEKEVSDLRRQKFAEALTTLKPVIFEDCNNGRFFHHNFNPVIGSKGQVDKVAIFIRDITEEKKTQQLLIEGTRLKAIGEMASGVAHNFNNVLYLLIGTAQAGELLLEQGRIAESMESFRKIADAANLGAQTVKRLQDFARTQVSTKSAPPKIFDLSKTVEGALEMTSPVWKNNPLKDGVEIRIEKIFEPECFILGHESEIFEVVINFIKNAVEAMPQGGKLTIKTNSDDSNVYFEITDTGVGIDEKDLEKIFTPFWSTKGFKGTGIGLASSLGIVRGHNGQINVKSQKGAWTTFSFVIPKAK